MGLTWYKVFIPLALADSALPPALETSFNQSFPVSWGLNHLGMVIVPDTQDGVPGLAFLTSTLGEPWVP